MNDYTTLIRADLLEIPRDDLIREYFFAGFTNDEISTILTLKHKQITSRQIRRLLCNMGLRRRNNDNIGTAAEAIRYELQGSGRNLGYRVMKQRLVAKYGLLVSRTTQFTFSNWLFGCVLIALVFLGVYILWRWCSEEKNSDGNPKSTERLTMKPVYAHEIEPGIVVLQSEDGDYFKILKEYDMCSASRYGSVSCTRPQVAQPTLDLIDGSDLPSSFTQTRFQTQRPSAPPALMEPLVEDIDFGLYGTVTSPPPYAYN